MNKYNAVESDLQHSFDNNLYMRRLSVKSGTAILGAVHKHPYTMAVWGAALIIQPSSGEYAVAEAGKDCMLSLSVGAMSYVVVFSDSVFITTHDNSIGIVNESMSDDEITAALTDEPSEEDKAAFFGFMDKINSIATRKFDSVDEYLKCVVDMAMGGDVPEYVELPPAAVELPSIEVMP